MGYRVWNNYEDAAEEERRAAWAALPLRRRALLRLRQAAILVAIVAFVSLIFARITGLF